MEKNGVANVTPVYMLLLLMMLGWVGVPDVFFVKIELGQSGKRRGRNQRLKI